MASRQLETGEHQGALPNEISRLQRSETCPLLPGPMAQAIAFRALGAWIRVLTQTSEALGHCHSSGGGDQPRLSCYPPLTRLPIAEGNQPPQRRRFAFDLAGTFFALEPGLAFFAVRDLLLAFAGAFAA